MAIRTWLARPDQQMQTPTGDLIPVVSQEALLKALLDGGVVLDRAGGTLAVTVSRAETGIPGERVTTAAMVTWKDRTDAREAPEQSQAIVEETVPRPVSLSHAEVVAQLEAQHENGHPVAVSASGEEVDESDVPPELRGV